MPDLAEWAPISAPPSSYAALSPVNGYLGAGVKVAVPRPCLLLGWSVTEWYGFQDAKIDLYDGVDTTGAYLGSITFGAAEATRDWFGPQGVQLATGFTMNVLYGRLVGSVFYQ